LAHFFELQAIRANRKKIKVLNRHPAASVKKI